MKRYGLIGRDISYSLSPMLHEVNFTTLNMDATYELIDVNRLDDVQFELYEGLNITVPYKEDVLAHCDSYDPAVLAIGACNTIKIQNGKLKAFNTDWVGFIELLKKTRVPFDQPLNALVIGAGGAAKAVWYALQTQTNFQLTITNRTLENAFKISENALSLKDAEKLLTTFDVIIQTTSVGVKDYQSPIEISDIKPNSIFIDLNYQKDLKFLDDSKRLGAKTFDGLTMLVEQAAESFRIWTGLEPNKQSMYKRLNQKER